MIPEIADSQFYDPALDGQCGKESASLDKTERAADGQIRAFGSKEELEVAKRDGYGMMMVKRMPDRDCKKCFGRGHIGFNAKLKQHIPCKCVL